MNKRQMPKKGFYVYDNNFTGDLVDVVYTTGVSGKGGHRYFRSGIINTSGWVTLLWTCVPGKDEIKS